MWCNAITNLLEEFLRVKYQLKSHVPRVNDNFAGVFKHHRDSRAYTGLHLAKPPIWLLRVAHQHSRLVQRVIIFHIDVLTKDHPMNANPHDLTDLIGSRICHDLISPLGAISNGVELLSMSGGPVGPEMNLISESVENANARIRFFRIAFGAARESQIIGQPEVTSILQDLSRGRRLVTDWQAQGDMSRQYVKLAFLLHQCFESAMPWGGKITVSAVGDQWALYGQAEKMKIAPELWDVLAGRADKPRLEPANVHFALAPLAAEALGLRLAVECSENSARVRF